MKVNPLFPHKYKRVGLIILLLGVIFLILPGSIYNTYTLSIPWLEDNPFSPKNVNIRYTIVTAFFIIGGILTGFSKEKIEDEFIASLRLSSLMWAVIVNYSLLFIANIFIYGVDFLGIMTYNMFTILFIFLVRFNYLIYKYSKKDEK